MVTIQSNNNSTFKLNGKVYPRVFIPFITSDDTIALYNVFDVKQQLLASTKVNEYSVNGNISSNINTVVSNINEITYNVGGTDGIIDITAGANVSIDKTNPQNPIISASGEEGTVTDLSYNPSATNGVITNTGGNDATIPLATSSNAGLLAPSYRNILSSINTNYVRKGVDETNSWNGGYLIFSYSDANNIDYIAFNDTTNSFYFNADRSKVNTSANANIYANIVHEGGAALSSKYLGKTAKASDSNLLDGLNSTQFLRSTAKAVDSDKLDGLNSTDFLRSNGKAVDSDKLDGLDSSVFMRAQNANGYYGLVTPSNTTATWIRTTQSGILPYASGGVSSLGTSSWNFNTIYGKTLYENNAPLSSKYLGISAKAVDSDKVDGLHATSFVRSDTNDVKSGYLVMNDNSHLRLGSGSDFRMYFNGSHTYFDMYAGNLYFRQNSTTRITFERANGNITTTGTIYAKNFFETSDERLKTNIKPLLKGLNEILNINTYAYDWKHNNASDIGVIAQETEKVIPEIVDTNEDGYKSVSYTKLTPILINAIKEINERINKIENSI
ncbi:tail fiber domain-containing protein [Galbibacter sp. BG1]